MPQKEKRSNELKPNLTHTLQKDVEFFQNYVSLDRLTKLKPVLVDYEAKIAVLETPSLITTPNEFYSTYVERCKTVDRLLPLSNEEILLYEISLTHPRDKTEYN